MEEEKTAREFCEFFLPHIVRLEQKVSKELAEINKDFANRSYAPADMVDMRALCERAMTRLIAIWCDYLPPMKRRHLPMEKETFEAINKEAEERFACYTDLLDEFQKGR